ncbi:alpha/beta fold hydrolase [Corynebacterium sphenisci]|uniref:alpha/beta fold hydrolase n=1 Tax=Corynebacterium sphenisci TaxID=191493 RepID=UPI0026DEB99E|nr:alpha/beta hydrolase [Corynebacterium sphenisci]MDO5730504.1 alpha/beta hydrolase [Corynebacterium sphenisci]
MPRPRRRPPGWTALGGAAALATAAGAGVLGLRDRLLARGGPGGGAPLALPDPDWAGVIDAGDGTPLAVHEASPPTAPVTVVLSHGYCQRMDSWCLQARRLRADFGERVRLVLWDQRGHGGSGVPPAGTCTIGRTAADLAAVIAARAPAGPVVAVGHSMGGMTVLALGRVAPELVPRLAGVVLVATAADGLDRGGIPGMLLNPVGAAAVRAAAARPELLGRLRLRAGALAAPVVRGGSFGDQAVAPAVMALNEGMIDDTDSGTILRFFATLRNHDETPGAAALAAAGVPATIVAGDRDRMIPYARARELAAAWPGAELVRAPGVGHMVQLERPDLVDAAVAAMLRRVPGVA